MKNVLVMTSTFPRWRNDSTPSFVFALSNSLAENYQIVVLAPHAYRAAEKERMGNLKVYRFRYFFPKYQKMAYGAGMLPNIKKSFLAKIQLPLFLFSQFRKVKDLIEKEKISLIHAHWIIPQGLMGILLKKKYKLPLIVTIHGSDLFAFKNKFFRRIQKIVVENADMVTINSRTAEKELLSRFPEIKNKVTLIPMGIDTTIFRPKKVKNKFKEYKNDKIILFVGRLNEQKGAEYLIKAMPHVVSQVANAKLLVIGEGNYGIYLEKLANQLRLGNSIKFLGPKNQHEVADYCNLAEVLVLPSVTTKLGTEAFGIVLIEAMACGTCVIGSSSGGIKDIIKDNVNGLIFQERNSKELADKITRMLNDDKLRKKLSKNGLAYARQNYDWRIISKKFLKLYEQLLK